MPTQELENIIDRRWEVAKQQYPEIDRETISKLVYGLAQFFNLLSEQKNI